MVTHYIILCVSISVNSKRSFFFKSKLLLNSVFYSKLRPTKQFQVKHILHDLEISLIYNWCRRVQPNLKLKSKKKSSVRKIIESKTYSTFFIGVLTDDLRVVHLSCTWYNQVIRMLYLFYGVSKYHFVVWYSCC